MNYPALIFWVLIAWSTVTDSSTVFILLLGSIPFASLALLPPDLIFGLSILPQSMFAVLLVFKVILPELPLSPRLLNALRLSNLGFLLIFVLIGGVVTALAPRLFWGEVIIVPMREVTGAEMLMPTPSNFSQFAYVTLSMLVAFASMLMASSERFIRTLLAGVLVGSTVCVATGN